MKWEYWCLKFFDNDTPMDGEIYRLSELGQQGWEVFHTRYYDGVYVCLLKRPVPTVYESVPMADTSNP